MTGGSENEEKLRLIEERYRALMTLSPVGIFRTDAEGGCVYVNNRWCEITGLTLEQAAHEGWSQALHPEDRDRVFSSWTQASQENRPFAEEYRFRSPAGVTTWVFGQAAAELGPEGQVLGYVGTLTDITERKDAELERAALQSQVQQAQKLQSLGVLAGGVAHDFNNLLTGILSEAEQAADSLGPASEVGQQLGRIRDAAIRAADLTRQMVAYAGREPQAIQAIDLGPFLRETIDFLRASLPKGVNLQLDVPPSRLAVEADAGQLLQVVMNLVINAGEAIGDVRGMVRLSAEELTWDSERSNGALGDEGLEPGDYVRVRVQDTGTGMDGEAISRIFDPFFTTKGSGRGLGLAAIQGIMRAHGGAIQVESEVGRGTEFSLLFKASATEPRVAAHEGEEHGALAPSGAKVLVVDDEKSIRNLLTRLLRAKGFEVLVAEDGLQGAKIFQALSDQIAFAVLDLKMPVLDGPGLFTRMRALNADVPVIVSSGCLEGKALQCFADASAVRYLRKPFRMAQFAEAVAWATSLARLSSFEPV